MIIQTVNWYLRYALSYRDIEELFLERGVNVDHSTLNRWVLRYAPLLEKRLRDFRNPHCGKIRANEIYIKVKKKCIYLYRAINQNGTDKALIFPKIIQRSFKFTTSFCILKVFIS